MERVSKYNIKPKKPHIEKVVLYATMYEINRTSIAYIGLHRPIYIIDTDLLESAIKQIG